MRRLSRKSEKVIKEMTEGGRLFENPLSVMAREGARMMLRVALEEEMTTVLGRALPFLGGNDAVCVQEYPDLAIRGKEGLGEA